MALYQVTNDVSSLAGIECVPQAEGNFTFFYIRDSAKTGEMCRRLAEMGQTVVSETSLEGQTAFITRGNKTQDEIMGELRAAGDNITLKPEPHKTNWWAFRGWASNVGQVLQLISALKEPAPSEKNNFEKPKYAPDQGTFAILNLLANITNIVFGGQKEKDKHRLQYIKENQEKLLSPSLSGSATAPDMETSHSAARKDVGHPPTIGQKCYAFMRKNAVRAGEIGLRYLGSLALVFPTSNLGEARKNLQAGDVGGAIKSTFTPNTDKPYNLASGITYLIGKTIAFFSRVPDPYNPTPPSALDKIREKYFFRTASVIETGAAGILAYGNYKDEKPLGAIGGLIFMGGLTTRFFAPFGHKEVDTEEVFAYTSDFLAREPRGELPQLVAESAALLARDLSGQKGMSYGAVYTRLRRDLYAYHNIALDSLSVPSPDVKAAESKPPEAMPPGKRQYEEKTSGFRNASSEVIGAAHPSSARHADQIALNGPAQALQVGA